MFNSQLESRTAQLAGKIMEDGARYRDLLHLILTWLEFSSQIYLYEDPDVHLWRMRWAQGGETCEREFFTLPEALTVALTMVRDPKLQNTDSLNRKIKELLGDESDSIVR